MPEIIGQNTAAALIAATAVANAGAVLIKKGKPRLLFMAALDAAAILFLALNGTGPALVLLFAVACVFINIGTGFLPEITLPCMKRAGIPLFFAAAAGFFAVLLASPAKPSAEWIMPGVLPAAIAAAFMAAFILAAFILIRRCEGGEE